MTGYQSKRAAAQDKMDDDDTQVYIDHGDALTAAYMSGYHDGKKAALAEQKPMSLTYEFGCSQCGHTQEEEIDFTKEKNT